MTGVGGNNIDIWYSHPYLSHPSQHVKKIKWLMEHGPNMYGDTMGYLYVKVKGTKPVQVVTLKVDKHPGSDLLGAWERQGTVSVSRLEGIDVS